MGKLEALDPILLENLQESFYSEPGGHIDSIVDLIKNNIKPPFSIAMNGAWGSGKTTILKAIKKKLEGEYPVIWFNPWEYDQIGDVVIALQAHIAREFIETNKKALIRELGIFAIALFTSGISAIAKKVGSVGYGDVKKIESDIRKAMKKFKYESYEDYVETVKKDFIRITDLLCHKYDNKPLIVFLDDLDRCLPENAIKLLEALKNQFVASVEDGGKLKKANVIFITGIDTSVAKQFIKKRYEGIEDAFAINYFRKIFNLTLDIPNKPKMSLETYLAEYTNKLFTDDDNNDKTPLRCNVAEFVKIIIDLGIRSGTKSIRSLLNIINNYFILKEITKVDIGFPVVVPILFIKENWYDYYELFRFQLRKASPKVNPKDILKDVLNHSEHNYSSRIRACVNAIPDLTIEQYKSFRSIIT